MLQFLKNSQDPVKAEELNLRGGVGLAAPQLDISKRIIAVHVPSVDPEKPENGISTVMYNPKNLEPLSSRSLLGRRRRLLISRS